MGVIKLLKASEAKAQIFYKDDTLSQSKHVLSMACYRIITPTSKV
jgi:hypothetical protein